jgi:hypothetical protein
MPARRGPELALGAPSLGGNTLGSSRKEVLRVAPRDVPNASAATALAEPKK